MKPFLKTFVIAAVLSFFTHNSHALEVNFEEDNSLPLVHLDVVVKTGAISDPAQKSGLTHFMGELMTRETNLKNRDQLSQALDQLGSVLDFETHAESISLHGSVLSSKLSEFLDLIGEIITEPRFSWNQIDLYKKELVSQILEERGNDQALAERQWQTLFFGAHPYAKRTEGKIKDIESINRLDLKKHYKSSFSTDRMFIAGSGDAQSSFIKTWADRLAEKLPAHSGFSNKALHVPVPKDPEQRRLFFVDKPERTQTQILVGQVGLHPRDPKYVPFMVANQAFGGGGLTGKLFREIRVKRGWSYGAYSYTKLAAQPHSWHAYLFPAAKDSAPALKMTLALIEDFKYKGIEKSEFDFAKESAINSALFTYNTPMKRINNLITEKILGLEEGYFKNLETKIAAVSYEEAKDAVKAFIEPSHLTILVLGTKKDLLEPIAEAAEVKERNVEVVPYNRD